VDVIFLDANVLFGASYRQGANLLRLWELDEVRLVTSSYAVEEARRNIRAQEHLERFHELISQTEVVRDLPFSALPKEVMLPEKDRPILSAAIAAGATHLLTGDCSHFGRYYGRRVQNVLILPPAEYVSRRSRKGTARRKEA